MYWPGCSFDLHFSGVTKRYLLNNSHASCKSTKKVVLVESSLYLTPRRVDYSGVLSAEGAAYVVINSTLPHWNCLQSKKLLFFLRLDNSCLILHSIHPFSIHSNPVQGRGGLEPVPADIEWEPVYYRANTERQTHSPAHHIAFYLKLVLLSCFQIRAQSSHLPLNHVSLFQTMNVSHLWTFTITPSSQPFPTPQPPLENWWQF